MIDYATTKAGDRLRITGMGAPKKRENEQGVNSECRAICRASPLAPDLEMELKQYDHYKKGELAEW